MNQLKAFSANSFHSNFNALTISCISLNPSTTVAHCPNFTQLSTFRHTAPKIIFFLLRRGLESLICGVFVVGVFKAEVPSSSKLEESLSLKLERSESKLWFLLENSS